MNLPIYAKPVDGELWQGYVMRLATMNGYDSLDEFERRCLYGYERPRHSGAGYPESLTHVCERMRENLFFPDVISAMAMTPYYAEMDRLSEGKQARLAESILYDIREPMTPNFRKREKFPYRVCPECMDEDIKEHRFWYLHLKHHLPGVCVCTKHRVPLLELEKFDKRHDCTVDMESGTTMEIEDLESALTHAKVMEHTWNKHLRLLKIHTCSFCGKEYLTHPYSYRTGAGCPYCRHKQSEQMFLEHRLKILHGNEYVLTEQFTGLTTTKATHLPCGTAKKTLDMLFYDETGSCSGCRALTVEKMQQRIDPEKNEFLVLKLYRNEHDTKKVRLRHLTCGREFDYSITLFLKWPHCPICEKEQRLKYHSAVMHSEYIIISDYRNNHDKTKFRHMDCGCVFETSKTSFLAGTRCPVCTNHYNYQMVVDAIQECAPSYHIKKSDKRGNATLFYENKRIAKRISYTRIINDLQSETPILFLNRGKQYVPPKSIRRQIYDSVLNETTKKGYWKAADGIEGHPTTVGERNILQDLTNQGFIERTQKGVYRICQCEETYQS